MQLHKPTAESWNAFLQRPAQKTEDLTIIVSEVFRNVQTQGDEAVKHYTALFDKVQINNLQVADAISDFSEVPQNLKDAIALAYENIKAFHASQRHEYPVVERLQGVRCWMETRPIERVGIYIPGGTAPLFSTVLMLGIPAVLAGCQEIVLCTPPDSNGNINPAIHYTASLLGIKTICKAGGIQAIAAMTYGTESIPKVDKIFGPGNQYVTAAKQFAQQQGVAIDMPAGPSELLIIADATANPEFVAADLLSQAEHGADSQVILVSTNEEIAQKTITEIEKQLAVLPRKGLAEKSLENSHILVLPSLEDCFSFSNQYAPEHLILAMDDAENHTRKIAHAGSVFLGHYSCESLGDYASGTNHTLPTYGFARNYSGVSLASFQKTVTFQSISKKGISQIGKAVELMAEAEQLQAHKNAVTVRMSAISQ
ncbi:MAG: histidinol dehydrogenase [Capnocytophaga sp.]|nr:histidinol dehydrogenase [Capnocytophaga sp.]